jgi:hypothetical protein
MSKLVTRAELVQAQLGFLDSVAEALLVVCKLQRPVETSVALAELYSLVKETIGNVTQALESLGEQENEERAVEPEDINAVAHALKKAAVDGEVLCLSDAEFYKGLAVAGIDELIKRGNHVPKKGIAFQDWYDQLSPNWKTVIQACHKDQYGGGLTGVEEDAF